MATKYDEEEHTYLKLEMFNSEDVAQNGEMAKTQISYHGDDLPSPDIVAIEVKKAGFDTFEVTHVNEKVMRFTVD